MSDQHCGLIFEVDVPEAGHDELAEQLAEKWDCRLDLAGGRWLLTCYRDAPSCVEAAARLVVEIFMTVPALVPVRLDHDLVAVSDIAARLGCSRQAVHQFANARSGFPIPYATVASTRIWRWADVNEWLREHRVGQADPERWPTMDEAIEIDALLLRHRIALARWAPLDPRSGTVASRAESRALARPSFASDVG